MDSFGPKQPYEEYYIDFDFSKVIVSPDTVTFAEVTVVDESGGIVTGTITNIIKQHITSPKVYAWIMGGTSGVTYILTCKISTANGEKYEKDGKIRVEEIDYSNQ